jgi:type I restriction enzyme S subunit
MKTTQFQKRLRERTLITAIPPKINKDEIGKVCIWLSNDVCEQQKIGLYFKQLDNLITLSEQELNGYKELKKCMLQKMFPKEGESVPEIRFPGFEGDWECRKLGDGMSEYTDTIYIKDDLLYKQVSIKNVGEICLRGEQIGAKIGRKRQAKVNLKEHPNTLIFTRQTIEQGGIGFAPKDVDGAIVTENMPTIDVNTNIFDRNFIIILTKTMMFRKRVILPNIKGGTAQIAIHEDDVLNARVIVPSLEEQQKIGLYFKQLDNLISLSEQELNEYKRLKKCMLQKMFC